MNVFRFTSLEELACLADDWDRLSAGVPFRSWAWMSTWWRHYGEGRRARGSSKGLYVLGVFDPPGRVIGIAPWYVDRSPLAGRTLRFLGSGEVCSEYLTVLADPAAEDRVAAAIAQHLTEAAHGRNHRPGADQWDLLELTSVDAADSAVGRLVEELRGRGNLVHQRPGPSCWRVELPGTWDQYLAALSQNRRRQLRIAERRLVETGRAVFHVVRREEDLAQGIGTLIHLHQRRRQALGEPGCFASPRFTAFHCAVMPQLLRNRRLHLFWVELDGKPAAAEYFLLGDNATYAYQVGLDPDRLKESPGQLGNMIGLRHAIALGHTAFDFLRGNEPYKLYFRAQARATTETRVVPARRAARLRWGLWLLGSRVKRRAKILLRRATHGEGEGEINHEDTKNTKETRDSGEGESRKADVPAAVH